MYIRAVQHAVTYFRYPGLCMRLTMKGNWPLSTRLPPTILPALGGTGESKGWEIITGTGESKGWEFIRGTGESRGREFFRGRGGSCGRKFFKASENREFVRRTEGSRKREFFTWGAESEERESIGDSSRLVGFRNFFRCWTGWGECCRSTAGWGECCGGTAGWGECCKGTAGLKRKDFSCATSDSKDDMVFFMVCCRYSCLAVLLYRDPTGSGGMALSWRWGTSSRTESF